MKGGMKFGHGAYCSHELLSRHMEWVVSSDGQMLVRRTSSLLVILEKSFHSDNSSASR